MTFLVGRSFRTGQVPNGSKFSCNTCHTSGGGSPRNPFGLEIQNNHQLSENAISLLDNPEKMKRLGQATEQIIAESGHSINKSISFINNILISGH